MPNFTHKFFKVELVLLVLRFSSFILGEPLDGFGWKANVFDKEHIHIDHIHSSSTSPENPVVTIRDGQLKGFITETIGGRRIASFRGIPYGLPPVGRLRFQAPLKAKSWNGIRDSTGESPQCIQIDFMTRERAIRGQEDCLYLEVHTPEITPSHLLPVMVWIHGGSFASGAGGLYGPRYLLDKNIVLVTINYRLSVFGFISTGDKAAYGNAGMKDQVLALKWVQENIAKFGGDPNSVTIFGQSAGAGAVQHHIVSPLSQGLFHRGISQSGSSLCWWAISENAVELAYKTGSLFGCQGNSQQLVSCLQNIPAERLVTAHMNLTSWSAFPIVIFAPVIEPPHPNAFFSEHPTEIYKKGKASRVPWITGFTRYEMGWLFAEFIQDTAAVAQLNRQWDRLGPIFLSIENSTNSRSSSSKIATKIRDFYLGQGNTEIGYRNRFGIAQMLGDRFFLKCGLDGMHLHSHYTGESVYGYELSFEGKYSIVQLYGQNPLEWGVAHLDDVSYLLNNTEHFSTIRADEDLDEYKMVEVITSIWSDFATYGISYVHNGRSKNLEPNAQENVNWEPITQIYGNQDENYGNLVSSFKFLDLNLAPRMIKNPYIERYKFWTSLQLTD